MLYLDHVEVLSLDYTPQYFGDLFHYNTEKRLSVRGKILNLSNSSGISGVWSGMASVIKNQDYDEIVLNGQSFGRGKISDTVFEEGVDIREKSYTTNITVYESGNLFNMSGGNYNGINIPDITFLNNLDESLTYSKNEDGGSNYQHKINIAYRSGFNISNTQRNLAQTLASGLFAANSLTGFLGLYNYNHIKRYTETYNLINQECNFTQNYQFYQITGNYSINFNNRVELGEDGFVTATEQGNIVSLISPSIDGVYIQLKTELDNSFIRCQAITTQYLGGNIDPLSQTPIEQSTTINEFNKSIDYSVNYTNNPSVFDKYTWIYTTTIEKAQDGLINLSEKGSVIGRGRLNLDKYTNARNAYTTIKPGILNRLQTYYNVVASPNFEDINLVNLTQSFNKYNGVIEYSANYSDDLTLQIGSIRKVVVEKETSYPVHLNNNFNILNVGEITQPTQNATVGIQNMTITLWGDRNLSLNTFVNRAKQEITEPDGSDVFLSDANYSLDPFSSQFTLNVTHNFHGSKSFTSNTVDLSND